MEEDEVDVVSVKSKPPEEPPPPRKLKPKLLIPRRQPSVVVPPRRIVYTTPDKTTCVKCSCFPKEDPYAKPKKLNPCQKSPLSLYELSAAAVDGLMFPDAFDWSVQDVADWMEYTVGLPEYRTCILDNQIDGRRLLLLEDPSHMPMLNIHYLEHVKIITNKIREAFSTDFIQFARSIGLPPRKPLTHCTIFKSRTGPSWGIRQNWKRCDTLRWMKIIHPEPIHLDHWDLVWYQKPDFPKLLFGKIPPRTTHEDIPHYKPSKPVPCNEYMAPRKFRLDRSIADDKQMIWLEHRPGSPVPRETELAALRKKKKTTHVPTVPKKTRLDPKKIELKGLTGKDLILARRLMPKKKFLVFDK